MLTWTLVNADEQHNGHLLSRVPAMSVSIGCNGSLPPYYGTRSATYFQQIDRVSLGDGPKMALGVQGKLGLHSQAGRRRGDWVVQRNFNSTPSAPYCTNRASSLRHARHTTQVRGAFVAPNGCSRGENGELSKR